MKLVDIDIIVTPEYAVPLLVLFHGGPDTMPPGVFPKPRELEGNA